MQPTYIRTPEELAANVVIGTTTESLVLDFKRTLNNWAVPRGTPDHVKAEAQREACRDLAQFANTNGGCLLIGVAERFDPVARLKVAAEIYPVPDPDAMRQWIEEAIRNYLIPATFAHDISVVADPRGTVLAVNVPPSIHLITLWDSQRHTIECLRRTSHGKDWMNPDELEAHIMNGSRAARLAFDLAFATAPQKQVQIAGGCWQRPPSPSPGDQDQRLRSAQIVVGLVTDLVFELKFSIGENTLPLNLPYGVINEAWVGADECLNLLLDVRVVYWRNHLILDPPLSRP